MLEYILPYNFYAFWNVHFFYFRAAEAEHIKLLRPFWYLENALVLLIAKHVPNYVNGQNTFRLVIRWSGNNSVRRERVCSYFFKSCWKYNFLRYVSWKHSSPIFSKPFGSEIERFPHFQNARCPISCSCELSSNITVRSFQHSLNAAPSTIYTLAGICTSVRPVLQNAHHPIFFSWEPFAKVTFYRFSHLQKESPMVYTLAGIYTSVRFVYQNAPQLISFSYVPAANITFCRLLQCSKA